MGHLPGRADGPKAQSLVGREKHLPGNTVATQGSGRRVDQLSIVGEVNGCANAENNQKGQGQTDFHRSSRTASCRVRSLVRALLFPLNSVFCYAYGTTVLLAARQERSPFLFAAREAHYFLSLRNDGKASLYHGASLVTKQSAGDQACHSKRFCFVCGTFASPSAEKLSSGRSALFTRLRRAPFT